MADSPGLEPGTAFTASRFQRDSSPVRILSSGGRPGIRTLNSFQSSCIQSSVLTVRVPSKCHLICVTIHKTYVSANRKFIELVYRRDSVYATIHLASWLPMKSLPSTRARWHLFEVAPTYAVARFTRSGSLSSCEGHGGPFTDSSLLPSLTSRWVAVNHYAFAGCPDLPHCSQGYNACEGSLIHSRGRSTNSTHSIWVYCLTCKCFESEF